MLCMHAALCVLTQGVRVLDFADMRSGLGLGALLAAHWPSGHAAGLLGKLHTTPRDARQLAENQCNVVRALQVPAVAGALQSS
jgi:hypothetical protein